MNEVYVALVFVGVASFVISYVAERSIFYAGVLVVAYMATIPAYAVYYTTTNQMETTAIDNTSQKPQLIIRITNEER